MLKLIDVYEYYDIYDALNTRTYYGLLDTELDTLTYVTFFDLQKYCYNTEIEIDGVTYRNLNSVGKDITVSNTELVRAKGRLFRLFNDKIADYNKLRKYKLGKLPPYYKVVKDNLIFSFMYSQKKGFCWHVELFPCKLRDNDSIHIPKTLLGYPVKDATCFFSTTLTWKTETSRYNAFLFCNEKAPTLDFSKCDFSFIEDFSGFFSGLYTSLTLHNLNFSSMLYCDDFLSSARCTENIDSRGFQILDLSFSSNPSFILADSKVVYPAEGVLLVLVNKNSWLTTYLQNSTALDLGTFTNDTKEQIIKRVENFHTKYLLMNKPFKYCVFYAIRED